MKTSNAGPFSRYQSEKASPVPAPSISAKEKANGKSFDWANAPDDFKILMQEVNNVHRRYAAEDTSGSFAKNSVANLFIDYMNRNRTFTESEISQLQSKVHKITGNGEVMMLFNELLGVAAG